MKDHFSGKDNARDVDKRSVVSQDDVETKLPDEGIHQADNHQRMEKSEEKRNENLVENGPVINVNDPEHHHLRRGLKARHITMIAMGGAVGTGLIIGTGTALEKGGPATVLICYSIVGLVVYLVMCALGEMATFIPDEKGFAGQAARYVDEAFGFAVGYTYWFKYIVVTPNQLTAAALVLQYWVPATKVNPGVFITIFLLAIVLLNYFGIKIFGEVEFWLSCVKVVVILGLNLALIVIACGGAPTPAPGFKYWSNPGAFNEYIAEGAKGRFLGIWTTFTIATFAFLGTELVGVTVGEAQNPRVTVPRAIRLTFYRIVFFYIVSVFLLEHGCAV